MQVRARPFLAPPRAVLRAPRVATDVRVHGKSKGFNVEVIVDENEPVEAALRRFTRSVKAARIVYEGKRRRRFESKQDIKKRKVVERGLFKRMPEREEWTEVRGYMDPSPFADMFGDPEDIFEQEAFEDFEEEEEEYGDAEGYGDFTDFEPYY